VDIDGPLSTVAADQLDGRRVLELAADGDLDALRVVERVGATLGRVVSVLAAQLVVGRARGIRRYGAARRAAAPRRRAVQPPRRTAPVPRHRRAAVDARAR
jgi:hypothetical protein